MNITVYLGASRGNDPSYEADASALGAWIAEHGHTLIYGGSRTGLMGALSAGALKKGGSVIGVEPQEFIDTALQQEGLTELIVTPDMASRKAKMMELGDIFLAFPGGFGTLEEISQVMSEVKLGHLKGRFAFLDFNGYYQPLKAFLEAMSRQGFVDAKWVKAAAFLPSLAALSAFVAGRELPKPGNRSLRVGLQKLTLGEYFLWQNTCLMCRKSVRIIIKMEHTYTMINGLKMAV